MSKTVKNGSGIWVDPPPVFLKFPHFPVFFFLATSLTTGPKEIKFNQRDIDVPWSSATVRRVLRKKKQSI